MVSTRHMSRRQRCLRAPCWWCDTCLKSKKIAVTNTGRAIGRTLCVRGISNRRRPLRSTTTTTTTTTIVTAISSSHLLPKDTRSLSSHIRSAKVNQSFSGEHRRTRANTSRKTISELSDLFTPSRTNSRTQVQQQQRKKNLIAPNNRSYNKTNRTTTSPFSSSTSIITSA